MSVCLPVCLYVFSFCYSQEFITTKLSNEVSALLLDKTRLQRVVEAAKQVRRRGLQVVWCMVARV